MPQEPHSNELHHGLRAFCSLTPRQRHALIEIMEEMLTMNAEQARATQPTAPPRLRIVR